MNSRKGFASLDRETRLLVASKGGIAASQKGTAHRWTPDEAKIAGAKGGKIKKSFRKGGGH